MPTPPAPPRPSAARAARVDVRDWVTPEDLNVDPALLGRALARPARRAGAIAIDLVAIAALSSLASGWLLLAAGLALLVHAVAHWRGVALGRLAWAAIAGVLVTAALLAPRPAPRPGPADPGLEQKVEALAEAITAAATGASAPAAAHADLAALSARIERLEAELAQARKSAAQKLRDDLDRWLDEAGISFGWALVYFSLLPAWWNGQTLGKRLLGLRVVELTGKPLGVLACLKRYGGYAAGMATGGLGFLQILWDPNRQALQDKTAHTLVLDLRRRERLAPEHWPALPPR